MWQARIPTPILMNGGDGLDTADYSGATAAVTVNLQANTSGGAATGDTFALVENVIGSSFDDTLTARDGGTASGGGGNDTLGGAGAGTSTILVGGEGNDTLSGFSFGQELMQLELGKGVDLFTSIFRTTDSDRLVIDNSVFDIGLGVTANEIRNLATGPATANIATAQFIYVQDTTQLYYDADGTGATAAPVLLATLGFAEGGNTLQVTDFYVI